MLQIEHNQYITFTYLVISNSGITGIHCTPVFAKSGSRKRDRETGFELAESAIRSKSAKYCHPARTLNEKQANSQGDTS